MSEQLIYESKRSKLFYVDENNGDKPTVKKVLNYEFPSPTDIAQFYNEFEILDGLEIDGVRKVLKRTKDNNRHSFFMEWIKEPTLKDAFKNKQKDVEDFLYIAIAIAQVLEKLHNNHIIHKDINPFNVLVDIQLRKIYLIDFGIASKIDIKQRYVANPEYIEGTLAYNSPEQTGRMNRIVDYRTDLYSAGITFYEMLTGQPPFVGTDALELVHSHIAITPKPVYAINSAVPRQLSAIVARLLAKNAEDRYQSAFGLRKDLEKCLVLYQDKREIPLFPLAKEDYFGNFNIPQKLYGRQNEVAILLLAFENCALGRQTTLFISGSSGTGKSVLVNEICKPITAKKGYFVEGKFDQLQRSVPYFAVVEAFKELINIFLTENEETLIGLRENIQQALGIEGKVLTKIIPNLENIIGVQPDVPEIGGAEAQNRFTYMIRKFVKAIAIQEHPIVLFIDDLQWADSASLNFLQTLATEHEPVYLFCIGAYRDNDVGLIQPVNAVINNIREAGGSIETLAVGNLPESCVSELVADTLHAELQEVADLTDLIYHKTSGNAYFFKQFLKSLYDEQLLVFDFILLNWKWDLETIKAKNITDNVVELMTNQILKLPDDTQAVMKTGACIGSSFDLELLAVIHAAETESLNQQLYPAIQKGLVISIGNKKIKFAHDRIQQAVYLLIPAGKRNEVHLEIGRLSKKSISEDELEKRLFDIVNQWNFGKDLLKDPQEANMLAALNLRAGVKAKTNAAFQPALVYLETGISLLQENAWQKQYGMCLTLFTEAAEAAYLCADLDKTDRLFNIILTNARETLDKIKPYEIRILCYKAENRLHDAIHAGLAILAELGETFPKNPGMFHTFRALAAVSLRLQGRTNEQILNMPEMKDPKQLAVMRIIADITSSVYWAMPNLIPLIVFRMLSISLKYGNTGVSCFAYGSFGVLMCGVLGLMKTGYRYGKLSLALMEKLNVREWKAQIYCAPYGLVFHWNEHVKHTLAPLKESFIIGMETGLIEFACVNTNIYCIHSFLCGRPLAKTEEETKAYSQSYFQFKQETNYNYNEVYRQAMLNLMGRNADPLVLEGEAYSEQKMTAQNLERKDRTGTFFIHFNKLMLSYHFGEFEQANYHAKEAQPLLDAVLSKFEIPNYHFYRALTLLSLYPLSPANEKSKMMAEIIKSRNKLQKWSVTAPENFRHKYELIEAERLKASGNTNEARIFYDQAINNAAQNDYLHEQALAYELAGNYYLEINMKDLSAYYLKAAYNTYREWGAKAKLVYLENKFPNYISQFGSSESLQQLNTHTSISTSQIHGSALDIASVLKASTTISKEVDLPKLLAVLMDIVVENAGAQRGFLILDQQGELFIEAVKEVDHQQVAVLQHLFLEGSGLLAESIVKFVWRTRESVVEADAEKNQHYKNDGYIIQNKPHSIICLPIINQGKFIGILYLENNLVNGAFTKDRISLLSLLSGQIAVSIDNAFLYHNLAEKVNERTKELAVEQKKSDDLLYNILPFETAQELKQKGHADTRFYDKVSVIFTDFKSFTEISEKLSSVELVTEINDCFEAFDSIMEKYGIEKIKTIGDAYMAAGGLPVPNSTHAEQVVRAALEIRNFVTERKRTGSAAGFEVRIGVHTGPVVAGIVGSKKFAYDIWGDTVNTASRMESAGEVGKVNISQATYEAVKDKFSCQYRGEITAKGKGKIKMYFVE